MEKATSVHGQNVPVAVEHFRRFFCSWHCSPHISHLRDVDYVIELFFFFLKIAFETAKTFLALAEKIFFKKPSASGILLRKCHRSGEAELGNKGVWER